MLELSQAHSRGNRLTDRDRQVEELREIAASLEKSDLADVRSRLMDYAQRWLNFDLWIPSR